MVEAFALPPLLSAVLAPAILIVGAYLAAVASGVIGAVAARRSPAGVLLRPVRNAALLLRQEPSTTERPDALSSFGIALIVGAGLLAISRPAPQPDPSRS